MASNSDLWPEHFDIELEPVVALLRANELPLSDKTEGLLVAETDTNNLANGLEEIVFTIRAENRFLNLHYTVLIAERPRGASFPLSVTVHPFVTEEKTTLIISNIATFERLFRQVLKSNYVAARVRDLKSLVLGERPDEVDFPPLPVVVPQPPITPPITPPAPPVLTDAA